MLEDCRETIQHCLKCGACKTAYGPSMPICASGFAYGFESHYAVGRIEIAKAILDGRLGVDVNVMRRIYTCTSCGGCDVQCGPNVGIFPLEIIQELKREGIERGRVPSEVKVFLENINRYGNPYIGKPSNRGQWAENLHINPYSGQEYLFYVGCVGSYDERGKRISQALASLLLQAGVSFGILGSEEACDGNEVRHVGELGLFQNLAEHNIEVFRDKGVKKIVTLSPHAFNTMKNDYSDFGSEFEVFHYTQLLAVLLEQKKICAKRELRARLTYHDSCFLGRHNSVYEAPRSLMKAIPGVELVEMEMNRENAFCCGGGGGNFFTGLIGSGFKSPARVRLRQALEAGVEIIAVACPTCASMLEEAMKVEDFGDRDRIVVKDISEILREVC
jgi:Fe-S oxidoreductase